MEGQIPPAIGPHDDQPYQPPEEGNATAPARRFSTSGRTFVLSPFLFGQLLVPQEKHGQRNRNHPGRDQEEFPKNHTEDERETIADGPQTEHGRNESTRLCTSNDP